MLRKISGIFKNKKEENIQFQSTSSQIWISSEQNNIDEETTTSLVARFDYLQIDTELLSYSDSNIKLIVHTNSIFTLKRCTKVIETMYPELYPAIVEIGGIPYRRFHIDSSALTMA